MPDPVSRAGPGYSDYQDLCCRQVPAPTDESGAQPTMPFTEEPGADTARAAANDGAGGASNGGSEVDGGHGASSADTSTPPAPSADAPWRPRVNGCTVVPDRGAVFDFYAACKRHDLEYQTCGVPRWEADERLHDAMLESCVHSPAPEACRARADVYYVGVRVAGGLAYAAGQAEACREAPLASWPEDERYPGEPAP